MLKKKKLQKQAASLFVCGLTLAPYASPMGVLADDISFNYSYSSKNCDVFKDADTDGGSDSSDSKPGAPVSGSSFAQKVAGNEKHVREVLDYLKKMGGFSGEDIAVIMAHAARESAFDPTIENPSGNVAGIFQMGIGGVNGARALRNPKIKAGDKSTYTVQNWMDLFKMEIMSDKATVIWGGSATFYQGDHHGWPGFANAKNLTDKLQSFNEGYEGVDFLNDPQSKSKDVEQWTKDILNDFPELKSIKADYSKFPKPGQGTGANTGTDSGEEDKSLKSTDDCDDWEWEEGESNSDIVNEAMKWENHFIYGQVRDLGQFKDWLNPPKGVPTDCSGFVWFVLNKLGYDMPPNMQMATPLMESDAKGEHKYFEEVPMKDAKAGDIIVVNVGGGSGNDGHTGILQEDWDGASSVASSKTKIIDMHGPIGAQGPSKDHIVSEAMGSLLTGGERVTFMRAKKNGKVGAGSSGTKRRRVRKGSKKKVKTEGNAPITEADFDRLNKITNAYPYKQCTWGAAVMAPWAGMWGNGGDWGRNAKAEGYTVDNKPEPGALLCMPPGSSGGDPVYGHIAYVGGVKNGKILIFEANYGGTAQAADPRGIGQYRGWTDVDPSWQFIHPKPGDRSKMKP